MNIDTQTVHDLVTRQIDLMRYERSVRRDVLKQLALMQAEVEGRLKRKDLSELTRRELNALLSDIETILSRDYDLIADRLKTEQAAAVEDESAWLWAWLAALAVSQQAEPKPLSETAVKSLSDGLLVGGLTVAEAIAGQKAALMQQIKQAVRVAAVSGADAAADVADLFKRKARDLTAVTATWIGTLSAEVHYAFGKVNPLVKGFRHVSVLDGKTSSVCTARHGLVWDKNHNPIGHSYPFRRPALHPHCRSKLVFVFEPDAEFEGVTGEDWVKGRTLEQLQEQFGKGVGEMLHRRIITLNDAVRSDGLQAATLKEISRKRPEAADAVKIGKPLTKQAQKVKLSDTEQAEALRGWMGGRLYQITAGELENPRIKKRVKEYGLTQAEAVVLRHYTGSGYRDLNAQLRGQMQDEKVQQAAEIMKSALDKLPDYQGVVIRRDNLPAHVLKQHTLGNVVEYSSFTSATFGSEDVVISESPHRLKIKAKHAKQINWISVFDEAELEVLFTAPTRFEVKKAPVLNKETGLLEINLEEFDG